MGLLPCDLLASFPGRISFSVYFVNLCHGNQDIKALDLWALMTHAQHHLLSILVFFFRCSNIHGPWDEAVIREEHSSKS